MANWEVRTSSGSIIVVSANSWEEATKKSW